MAASGPRHRRIGGGADRGGGDCITKRIYADVEVAGRVLAPMVVNAQTDSYELVLADAGKLIEMGKATAQNLTVPLNSSVAFPVGTRIDVLQTGAGQVTVVATGGVTVNAKTGRKLAGQWAGATLIKRATDTWVLIGALEA